MGLQPDQGLPANGVSTWDTTPTPDPRPTLTGERPVCFCVCPSVSCLRQPLVSSRVSCVGMSGPGRMRCPHSVITLGETEDTSVLEDTVPAPWDHYLRSGRRTKMEFNKTQRSSVPPTELDTRGATAWGSNGPKRGRGKSSDLMEIKYLTQSDLFSEGFSGRILGHIFALIKTGL